MACNRSPTWFNLTDQHVRGATPSSSKQQTASRAFFRQQQRNFVFKRLKHNSIYSKITAGIPYKQKAKPKPKLKKRRSVIPKTLRVPGVDERSIPVLPSVNMICPSLTLSQLNHDELRRFNRSMGASYSDSDGQQTVRTDDDTVDEAIPETTEDGLYYDSQELPLADNEDVVMPTKSRLKKSKRSFKATNKEKFEVDSILEVRKGSRGVVEYKVKWLGYPGEDSWIPEKSLDVTGALYKAFWLWHSAWDDDRRSVEPPTKQSLGSGAMSRSSRATNTVFMSSHTINEDSNVNIVTKVFSEFYERKEYSRDIGFFSGCGERYNAFLLENQLYSQLFDRLDKFNKVSEITRYTLWPRVVGKPYRVNLKGVIERNTSFDSRYKTVSGATVARKMSSLAASSGVPTIAFAIYCPEINGPLHCVVVLINKRKGSRAEVSVFDPITEDMACVSLNTVTMAMCGELNVKPCNVKRYYGNQTHSSDCIERVFLKIARMLDGLEGIGN